MNQSKSDSYAAAGVDITAGYRAVELMKRHIGRTVHPRRRGRCRRVRRPLLPRFDGHQVARPGERDRRRGHQAQAGLFARPATTPWASTAWPCASTTSCAAARGPLFFLDYIACGKNLPERIERIVAGVAEGCVQAGCRLDRRRDGRNARLLSRGRIRPGRLLPSALQTRSSLPDKQRACEGRRADCAALERPALQRLFAGAPRVRRGAPRPDKAA